MAKTEGGGTIEFWFDFSSAYAYFAALEIDALAERVKRPLVWRPFLLGTAFQVTGARGLSSTPLKSDYARHDWARMARRKGVPFLPPANHPHICLAAVRVFYWIDGQDTGQDTGQAAVFARRVFELYYRGMLDTANLDEVAALAAEQGFERQAVKRGAASGPIKQLARKTAEAGVGRGVFGSPFFFVDGEPFWGSDRLDMLEDWIATGGW